MNVFKQTLLFIFFSAIVCSGAFYAGIAIPPKFEATIQADLKKEPGYQNISEQEAKSILEESCSNIEENSDLKYVCATYEVTQLLPYASVGTFMFTIAAIVFVHILGAFTSRSRKFIFNLFRPGLWIAKLLACVLMGANIALMTFSLFSLEYLLFTRIHIGIILTTIGFGVYALGMIIYQSFRTATMMMEVQGINLVRGKYPIVWSFVESIATQLNAPIPDNIVVGLNPNFWVTEAPVDCLIRETGDSDDLKEGLTLYLSLQYCRVLSKEELSCVIAHELAHFVGEDTAWSKKFAPIYKRAEETINCLDDNDDLYIKVAIMPACLLMKIFFNAFDKAVSLINRDRELAADTFAAKHLSAESLATALVKTHLFDQCWNSVLNVNPNCIDNNLSIVFEKLCKTYQWEKEDGNSILAEHTEHPTDTHPSLSLRLDNLAVDFKTIYGELINNVKDTSCIDIVNEAQSLERVMSVFILDGLTIDEPEDGWIELPVTT